MYASHVQLHVGSWMDSCITECADMIDVPFNISHSTCSWAVPDA